MHRKKSKRIYYFQFIFVIFSAFLTGYILNISQTKSFEQTNLYLFQAYVVQYLITVLILVLLYLAMYAIINRFFYASAVYYVFFSIYAVANLLKMKYRSEPILPTDLLFLTNTKELLTMVTFRVVLLVILAIILIVAIFVSLEKIFSVELLRFKPITRIVLICLGIVSIGSFYNVNEEGSVINKVMTASGYSNFTPNISMTASVSGPLLTFLGNMHVKVMDEPSGYSEASMNKLVKKYRTVADQINQDRPNKDLNKQTLIFVLSESFANPDRVPNVKMNQDASPNINNIKSNNTSGLMLSSGYGGGTANMEYMAFTGLAFNQFSRSLQSPYTQLVIKQKHPVNIVNNFENATALHPYYSNFYSRDTVYPKLGFQTFKSIDSKGSLALKHKSKLETSEYVSDEASYEDTLNQVNQNKSGQFISLVTMQNHMPYNVMYSDNQFIYKGHAASIPQQVANYAKEINYTDQATQDFLDKIDQVDKPITVVWYGDHLPGLYDKNSLYKYNVVEHETDYFIYSNKYALEHNYGTQKIDDNTAVTDPNGFIPLALKQMKQKVTPYYALLTRVQEELPAMAKNSYGKSESLYVNSDSKEISFKQLTKKQKQLIHDYKLVQYDLTAGKNYSKPYINK